MRYFSLWHPANRDLAARARLMLLLSQPTSPPTETLGNGTQLDGHAAACGLAPPTLCPHCRIGDLVLIRRLTPRRCEAPTRYLSARQPCMRRMPRSCFALPGKLSRFAATIRLAARHPSPSCPTLPVPAPAAFCPHPGRRVTRTCSRRKFHSRRPIQIPQSNRASAPASGAKTLN
jgi:hypothetical protein